MMSEEILHLSIETLAHQGDGVAEYEGKKLFIPHTLPGEEVEARVTKRASKSLHGELVKVIQPSPERAEPSCKHFSVCGGCSLQHMALSAYTQFKMHNVERLLARNGLNCEVLKPLYEIGAHSRRRAVLHVKMQGKKLRLGFHQAGSHRIVDLQECPVLEPALWDIIPTLREFLVTLESKDALTQLELYTDQSRVALLIHYKGAQFPELPDLERYTDFAHAQGNISMMAYKNQDGIIPVVQLSPVVLTSGEVDITMPPGTFQQATAKGQQAIWKEVQQAVSGHSSVIDIYSGCGAYSFALAEHASKVHAVEGSEVMVNTIRQTASRYHRHGKVTAEQRDLVRQPLPFSQLNAYQAIVINPPRNGAKAQAEHIARSNVPVVAMVSCNPNSFAVDAKILVDGGYQLASVLPIDQFIWSTHLELVAIFKRNT